MTTSREALKEALEQYLTELRRRYIETAEDKFPSVEELNRLNELATNLAQLLGKQKVKAKAVFGQSFSAFKLIENKYTKIGLIDFADALLKKLKRLPVSPLTKLSHLIGQAEQGSKRHDDLSKIYYVLASPTWTLDFDSHPWQEWGVLVQHLLTVPLDLFIQKAKPSTMQDIDFTTAREMFDKQFGYFTVIELQRQQLLWRQNYHKLTQPSAIWLYALQQPQYHDELLKMFHGGAPSPQSVKICLTKMKANRRRKRSYQKKNRRKA